MLRILLVHNHLRPPSGENIVFENEKRLLREKGHEVITYERNNSETDQYSAFQKVCLPGRIVWSHVVYRELIELIEDYKPEIAHFHNTFPLLSPSSYWACFRKRVPTVQTLHHFRTICPGALLFRDGRICDDCLSGTMLSSVKHGCYKGSRLQTALIASMLLVHRLIRTERAITSYIVLNDFCRSIFLRGGVPPTKLFVKPNFIFDVGQATYSHHGYALYLGRISNEKGVRTLIEAWKRIKNCSLKIVGEGESRESLTKLAKELDLSNVEFCGYKTPDKCAELIKGAKFLVVPSEWYETFCLVIREAFMAGKPVIASRLGVLAESVTDSKTGFTFEPGNAQDLAEKVQCILRNEKLSTCMGKMARSEFEEKYTADRNYDILIDIYNKTIQSYRG